MVVRTNMNPIRKVPKGLTVLGALPEEHEEYLYSEENWEDWEEGQNWLGESDEDTDTATVDDDSPAEE